MAGMQPRKVEGILQHRTNLHVDAIRRTRATLERSGSAIRFNWWRGAHAQGDVWHVPSARTISTRQIVELIAAQAG
jgi:hypothetical protein